MSHRSHKAERPTQGQGLCHIAAGPDKIRVEFHCKSPPAEPGMGAQYTCDQCLASGALGPGGKYTKVVKELESPLCVQTHVFIITVKLINSCVFFCASGPERGTKDTEMNWPDLHSLRGRIREATGASHSKETSTTLEGPEARDGPPEEGNM